jgi:hypothetical protein
VPHVVEGHTFYIAHAALQFLVLVAGFAPSFFLRPWFFPDPLPPHLLLHGLFGTAWFVLLLTQATLAARGRFDLHRRLGWSSAVLATLTVVTTVIAALALAPRLAEQGVDVAAAQHSSQVARDTLSVLAFALLLALGLGLRRRSAAHKRLMLLASIALLPPAIVRLLNWPLLADLPLVPAGFALLLVLILLIPAHDLLTRGRIHPASLAGLTYVAWLFGVSAAYPPPGG